MALTLLRHTTPDVAKGVCYGRTDLAVTSGFEAEAEAVLSRLPAFEVIMCSPLQRCHRLAQWIADRRGHEVIVAEHWKEMDFGAWEGMRWDAIPRAELDGWAADFHGFDGHGGESVEQLAQRVEAGLAAAPPGALIVTHMGCIKAALALTGHPKGWDAALDFGGHIRLNGA